MKGTIRSLTISLILPLKARRKRYIIKVVSKFRYQAISVKAKPNNVDNWKEMSSYETSKPFVRRSLPTDSQAELITWTKEQFELFLDDSWNASKNMARKISRGIKLPLEYKSGFSARAERKATIWYFNKTPGSQILTAVKPKLQILMTQGNLSSEKAVEFKELFRCLCYNSQLSYPQKLTGP